MEDGMLLILDSTICLTTRPQAVVPSGCLIAKGVYTESKSSHATNDIMGGDEGTCIWEEQGDCITNLVMALKGHGCRWSPPLVSLPCRR